MSRGFGSVYEGILGDGTMVSVKQQEEAYQGYDEFRMEISVMGSLKHRQPHPPTDFIRWINSV